MPTTAEMKQTRELVDAMALANAALSNADVIPLGDNASIAAPLGDLSDIPKSLDELSTQATRTFDMSVTAAADLKIPVVGSVSGGFDRRVVVLERVAYKPVLDAAGTELQYGYAIRLGITISKRTADMKLTLPFLAASAEVGSIEAKWILQVVGLAGTKIDKVSLPPTELSVETFVLAKQSLANLIDAVRDRSTKFSAQVIGMIESSQVRERNVLTGIGRSYAFGAIEKGWEPNRAIEELDSPREEIVDAITDAYRDFAGISDLTQKPSNDARTRARGFLGEIKVEPR